MAHHPAGVPAGPGRADDRDVHGQLAVVHVAAARGGFGGEEDLADRAGVLSGALPILQSELAAPDGRLAGRDAAHRPPIRF